MKQENGGNFGSIINESQRKLLEHICIVYQVLMKMFVYIFNQFITRPNISDYFKGKSLQKKIMIYHTI